MTKQQFIEAIAGLVKKYAYVYGITVHSPIIAQAIIESGWGESKLAATYHNYFGLKCGSKWTGQAGAFYWNLRDGVGNRYRYFGGRLVYVPTATA